MKQFKRTLVVVMAIGIAAAAMQPSVQSVIDRSRRVLEDGKFGDYSIQRKPEVKQYCEDKGINISDLNLPQDKLKEEMESVTSRFTGPREMLDTILRTQKTTGLNPSGAVNSILGTVGLPFVFAILSLLSFWFLFFWIIFSCCCKKTCCMKPIRQGDPLTGKQKCIFFSGLVVGLTLIIITIIWCAYIGSAINSIGAFPCAMASIYSDMVAGVKSKDLTFVGIDGVKHMVDQGKTAVNTFAVSPAGAIPGRNLDTRGTQLITELDNLYNTHKPSATTAYRMNVAQSGTDPDTIKAMDTTINTSLRTEAIKLKDTGIEFKAIGDYIATLSADELGNINKAFDDLLNQIDPLKPSIKNAFDIVVVTLRVDSIKTGMVAALVVTIIVVFIMTVLFSLTMFFTMFKDKWHCMKNLSKLFMIIKILLAVALNLLAALFAVVCIIFSNTCYFIYQASTDPVYTASIQEPSFQKMFTVCILPGGTGDMGEFMGSTEAASLQRIKDFNTANAKIAGSSKYETDFATATDPAVGQQLYTTFQNAHDCKVDDLLSSSPTFSFTQNINTLTGLIGPSNNEVKLSGACTKPNWDGTGGPVAKTFNSNANYCIEVGRFPFNVATGTKRWTNVNSGVVVGDETAIMNALDTLHTNYIDYQTKYAAWNTAYQTYYNTYEKPYFTDLKTSYADVKQLRIDSAKLSAFLSEFSLNMFVAMNCRVISKEIATIEVALCTKFTKSLMNTTSSMTGLGIVLFFFSWCICCGLRCAPKKEGAGPNQVAPLNGKSSPVGPASNIMTPAQPQQMGGMPANTLGGAQPQPMPGFGKVVS